jgi:putative transposase
MVPGVAELFLEYLDRSRHKLNFEIWAYVVMPEHVHLVICPKNEVYSMAAILKSIKGSFAKEVFRRFPQLRDRCRVGAECRFWQAGGGFDRNVVRVKAAGAQIRYAHRNPSARGLVEDPHDWIWSSINAYRDQPTPIPVDLCDWGMD